jgi:uncharacterized protein (TIGR02145 family)
MKKSLYLIIIIIAINSFSLDGQVVVYLKAKYLSELVNLDSIVVENTTHFDRMVLPAPPQINTYAIDLIKGAIINGISGLHGSTGMSILFNKPGHAGILLHARPAESFNLTLFDCSGRLIKSKRFKTEGSRTRIDIQVGKSGLWICSIEGKSFSDRVKLLGTDGIETSLQVLDGTADLKFSPDFTFIPGDSVRFTAYKSGMYKNQTCFAPQNSDTTVVFLSQPCPGTPFVTDYDGNVYKTVLINGLCWTRENMRTKHYANGTGIPDGTGVGLIGSTSMKYWFDYNDDPSRSPTYGCLYTAGAAFNEVYDQMTQGLCPNGWHVSSNIEWCEMEQYFDPTITNCLGGEGHGSWIGSNIFPKLAEAGHDHWYFWGRPAFSTNESGFTALGNGARGYEDFWGDQVYGYWWMSKVLGQNYYLYTGPATALSSGSYAIFRVLVNGSLGYSVRCIKDY